MSRVDTPQRVAVLGSTGSIGMNTLDVIARHPDRLRATVLTAHHQDERLFAQCQQFEPALAVMADEAAAARLEERIRAAGLKTRVSGGLAALEAAACDEAVDSVMAAIVGAAGLVPTLAAVRSGKRVLIANKEPLVMCGDLFIQEARRSGAVLVPIDSEHNAIFQCLPADYATGARPQGVRRVLLTCSGGPFLKTPAAHFESVTPEEACAHPNWQMGRKISVDSATLMNKGLELIEACWLFGLAPEDIEIVIHPQSVIHSMVEYEDGSVLAEMGHPDMRTPIAHALAWPYDRIDSGVAPLDLYRIGHLDFERPDRERFPALDLAAHAAAAGGTAPAVLNAANEIAVAAFLDHQISFGDIMRCIKAVTGLVPRSDATTLAAVLEADHEARTAASEWVARAGASMQGQA